MEWLTDKSRLSVISCQYHCQRSPSSKFSDMSQPEFEPTKNPDLDFVCWSCAVVITTETRHYNTCVSMITWQNSFEYKDFQISIPVSAEKILTAGILPWKSWNLSKILRSAVFIMTFWIFYSVRKLSPRKYISVKFRSKGDCGLFFLRITGLG